MVFNKRTLIHIFFWVFHWLFSFFAWDYNNYETGHFIEFSTLIVSSHLTSLLYFYANYFLWVPQLLLRKKYTVYVLAIIFSTVIFIFSKAFIWNSFTFIDGFLMSYQKSGLIFNIVFFFSLSTAFKMYDYWQESEEQKVALLQEVKETELLYLKSQMSPHFLFNTLNNIYGLSLNNSSQTSLSISQLKDMMLYIETFETENKITIEQEIHYLKSFIALNQLRYSTPVHFEISNNQTHQIFIEPMIYLPFIENAFKHGSIEENNGIQILLLVTDHSIHFSISNKVAPNKRKDRVGGIGIKNVQRRLELLYPQVFALTTDIVHSDQFSVKIVLKIA